MSFRIYSVIAFLIICSGCKGQNNAYSSVEPMNVKRFDKALFKLIESDDTTLQSSLLAEYSGMMEVTGKGILNIQSPDMPGFFDRLINYYSEPTLNRLYSDALKEYDNIQDIEQQLGSGFAYLRDNLPSLPIPDISMHVSGFGQNILVAENLLSVSIDRYMGKEYPLYQDFFYDYQKIKMTRAHIVPDYLTGWLMSEHPFTGKDNVLLDRMIYEGKIKYLVFNALPDTEPFELLGYTKEQYEWCKNHEGNIWKVIIENKHLYTPDYLITNQYFEDKPNSFFTSDAPGNIGIWLGWQIVNKFIKETDATPATLWQQTDAQAILTDSKYKPL